MLAAPAPLRLSLPGAQPPRGVKRAGPTQPVALHRSRAHNSGAGPRAQLEERGRATLWTAFALGSGTPAAGAAALSCPSGS